eukprot:COSAG05_NODE_1889_length_3884_cov_112.293999_3_plen_106_part_00
MAPETLQLEPDAELEGESELSRTYSTYYLSSADQSVTNRWLRKDLCDTNSTGILPTFQCAHLHDEKFKVLLICLDNTGTSAGTPDFPTRWGRLCSSRRSCFQYSI